jgi:hypothetical protein
MYVFMCGNKQVQGFTAVFGLFAVPPRKNFSELKKALLSNTAGATPQSMEDAVSALIASRRSQESDTVILPSGQAKIGLF